MPSFTYNQDLYYFGTWYPQSYSWTGLAETTTDTGKVVLQNDITENKGEILASGGLLPVNRYHVKRTKSIVTHARITGKHKSSIHYPNIYHRMSGVIDGATAFNVNVAQPTEPSFSILRQEAWADANSATFDLLTNLAELPESVAMARGFFSKLQERARRLANLRKVRAARSLEEFYKLFSEAWLEYRYGWRPLIGAARDLRDAVNQLSQEKDSLPVSGRAVREVSKTGTASVSWSGNWGGYTVQNSALRRHTLRSFVTHLIRRESAAIGVNPLVTAWELVPYSFVIDWFTGIGDAIASQWTPPGVTQTVAGSSRKTDVTASWKLLHAPAQIDLNWSDASCEYTHEEYQRWKDDAVPPEAQIVSGVDRMSLAQWTDLVLLAEGLLRRLFHG